MKILEHIVEISDQYSLSAIYVFGSRTEQGKFLITEENGFIRDVGADLDIGVLPQRQATLSTRDKARLTIELEDLFSISKIDLVSIPEANPFLAANIIRGERIYCGNENEVDEYELYVLRRAGDLIPLEDERIRLILGEEE